MNKISIITATFNAEKLISSLIESIESQTSLDFEWIVVDSCSTDNTIELVNKSNVQDKTIICEKDFGIYDALNKAVSIVSSDYYVVIGADDTFDPRMVENFKKYLDKSPGFDFYAAGWISNSEEKYGMKGRGWLYGMMGESACHSVSLLIRKDLHLEFGKYSNLFPICADQLFVKKAIKSGAKVKHCSFISGEFSEEGLSSSSRLAALTESYRVQVLTEKSKLLQTFIFLLKLLKNYRNL